MYRNALALIGLSQMVANERGIVLTLQPWPLRNQIASDYFIFASSFFAVLCYSQFLDLM